MQEQTITALCAALTAQQLPFAQGSRWPPTRRLRSAARQPSGVRPGMQSSCAAPCSSAGKTVSASTCSATAPTHCLTMPGLMARSLTCAGLSGMENSVLDTDAVRITAGAGQTLGRLCSKAQTLGLTGLEFACGIPGTVGGAVYMNAGAYGSELKDVLESVTFLDSDLQLRTLPAADLAMGYRTSILSRTPTGASCQPRWCCTAVTEPPCWPVCRSCWASAGKNSPLNGRAPAAPSSGPRARLRAS